MHQQQTGAAAVLLQVPTQASGLYEAAPLLVRPGMPLSIPHVGAYAHGSAPGTCGRSAHDSRQDSRVGEWKGQIIGTHGGGHFSGRRPRQRRGIDEQSRNPQALQAPRRLQGIRVRGLTATRAAERHIGASIRQHHQERRFTAPQGLAAEQRGAIDG